MYSWTTRTVEKIHNRKFAYLFGCQFPRLWIDSRIRLLWRRLLIGWILIIIHFFTFSAYRVAQFLSLVKIKQVEIRFKALRRKKKQFDYTLCVSWFHIQGSILTKWNEMKWRDESRERNWESGGKCRCRRIVAHELNVTKTQDECLQW